MSATGAARAPSPLPGLTIIAIGAIGAAMTTPDDVTRADALVQPSAFLGLALLAPVALRLRRDLSQALRAENFLLFGLVYWLLLDLLQAAYPMERVRSADVAAAFLAIGLFAGGLWLGASGRGWPLPPPVRRAATLDVDPATLFLAILASFTLGMLKFAIPSGFDPFVMIEGVQASRWAAPWARGEIGGLDSFADHLAYFGYLLPALCVMLAMKTSWRSPATLIAIALCAVMLLFLSQSGGRRIIGTTVGAGIVAWLAAQPRLHARAIFGLAFAAALLLLFMQEMLNYRNIGLRGWLAGAEVEPVASHLHVDDNFLRLAQIVMIFPALHEHVDLQPLYHALTLPVPRALWEGKPLGPGFSLPDLVNRRGVSLSSSIIGELYASRGFLAVAIGGLALGRIAGMWNKTLALAGGASRLLVFSVGVMALFTGLRSLQALVQMSYVVLAWMALVWLFRGWLVGPADHARAGDEQEAR